MVKLRKLLILSHRYLGIVLSLMFVMWFVTGIGMIYSRGMPRLTPQSRLARLAPLDMSAVHLSPLQAVEQGNLRRPDGRVTLLTVDGRPAYRFGGTATVYADNGEYMTGVDSNGATRVAANFLQIPQDKIHVAGQLTKLFRSRHARAECSRGFRRFHTFSISLRCACPASGREQ